MRTTLTAALVAPLILLLAQLPAEPGSATPSDLVEDDRSINRSSTSSPSSKSNQPSPRVEVLDVTPRGKTAAATALPVRISAVAGKAAAKAPRRVRIELLDDSVSERLNVSGFALGIVRADGARADGRVRLAVDTQALKFSYGGGFEHRIHLLRFPACAAHTPEERKCAEGTQVPATLDVAKGELRADIDVPAVETDARASAGGFVYAVAAGPSGGTGSYAAKPLSSAADWSAGGPSGHFTWSYPFRLPPSPAGTTPELKLSYSSGTVDGATAAENNQSSWAGMGFDLSAAYVERRYAACAYNGHDGGDLCWKHDNAFLVLSFWC
jgi:hypothetical protein